MSVITHAIAIAVILLGCQTPKPVGWIAVVVVVLALLKLHV